MAQLDVIVINADTFEKAALVQIAGRVGRKQEIIPFLWELLVYVQLFQQFVLMQPFQMYLH
jgi:hypothetical protein